MARAGKQTKAFAQVAKQTGPIRTGSGTARCTVACGHYARRPDGTHYRAEFNPGDVVKWAGYEESIRGGRTRYVKVQLPDGGVATFPQSYFSHRFVER